MTDNLTVKAVTTESQSQTLRNLVKVNHHNYVFDYKGGSQLFNLFITETKDLCVAKSLYTESNYDLIAMQADEHRIYVMI